MPRRCTPFRGTAPDGQPFAGIVCGHVERHHCTCGRLATIRCDHPVTRRGKPATCDRWCCLGCAVEVGPDRHHCGPHHRAREQAP